MKYFKPFLMVSDASLFKKVKPQTHKLRETERERERRRETEGGQKEIVRWIYR